jgi:hypothetical protein
MSSNIVSNPKSGLSKISIFTLSIIFIGSMITTTVNAQAALLVLIFGDKIATEKFHTSIDAGLNFSGMNGLDPSKMRHGLYFGLGTYLKINDKWAFTPEFKPLSQRGVRQTNALVEYDGMVEPVYGILMNYIDVPLLVQYKLTRMLFVSAGPQISFLTSAKQDANGTVAFSGEEIEVIENRKEDFNPLYISIPLEIGFSLPEVIPGQGIDLKIRYNIGLNEVIKNEAYGSSTLNTWQVMLSFPFIKKTN